MQCKTCSGTGKILCANSWFPEDGYRREGCGICGGSGEHDYRPDPDYARCQKQAAERVQQWGGLKPRQIAT